MSFPRGKEGGRGGRSVLSFPCRRGRERKEKEEGLHPSKP